MAKVNTPTKQNHTGETQPIVENNSEKNNQKNDVLKYWYYQNKSFIYDPRTLGFLLFLLAAGNKRYFK